MKALMYVLDQKTYYVVVNVILTAIALLGLLVQQPFIKPEWVPYIVFAQLALNIILKIWFSNPPQAKA